MLLKSDSGVKIFTIICALCFLISCAENPYALTVVQNYDDLVGKKFSDVIQFHQGYKKISETDEVENLENERPDGCAVIFGVRKKDGVITSWKVTPDANSCKSRRKAIGA